MITPDEITKKAVNLYPNYLKSWVKDEAEDFFPRHVPANLKLHQDNMSGDIRAVDLLREKSKSVRGWGYTVHWREVKSPIRGHNLRPHRIEIDSLDDLLRLARQKNDFEATCETVHRLREEFPRLANWLVGNVRTIAKYSENLEGLIAVTKFFQENPLPDCYARQIPVDVHTKFVEENKAVLRQWLDILLPASAIDVNESDFVHRFGLRDKQRHHAVRILDPSLLPELQLEFEEFSLPLRSLSKLPVRETTVVIVENWVSLHTLGALPRGLGIFGEGKAVTRLEELAWLRNNRILYWGDLDVPGLQILSSIRNLFPHVESILMDLETLETHRKQVIKGKGLTPAVPTNLTEEEKAVFCKCRENDFLLEQELIPQSYVDTAFRESLTKGEPKQY